MLYAPLPNQINMRIIKLTIKNYLKLKDVEMNPSQTNVIIGKNKQGKTSILKAIRTAFAGDADSSSIRVGEDHAEITVEMDSLNIKRTLTEKGNYLDVSNKEGMKMPAPQKFLNGILGVFSFNPVEFFDLKAADRKKYLLSAIKMKITQDDLAKYTGEKLAGLDYEAHALEVLEQARKYYYDQRTVANAEASKKSKTLTELTANIPSDFKPVTDEQIEAVRVAIQNDRIEKEKMEANEREIAFLRKQETDIKAQLESLKSKLKETETAIVSALEKRFDVTDALSLKAAEDTLKVLEGRREIVFTVKRADEVRNEMNEAVKRAETLDAVVKRLTKEAPAELLAKAELPIDGLAINGDDITVSGVSIDNLSSSEQLRLGLQVVRALNGTFKIVCIDGIESLDKESFEFFLNEIKDDDFQYFVTRVDGANGTLIEDGQIKQ